MARKWVLPTAQKQPIENVGARVCVCGVGALEESACLPHGALGPICSTTKKMKVILGAWLAFLVQNHFDNHLVF